MKRKMSILFLVFALFMTTIVGCGTEQKSAANDTASKQVKDSVVIAINADMGSWDPLNSGAQTDETMYLNIYSKLVDLDAATGKIVSDLADSWTIADDGLSYTFVLKKGVKFHNGEVFNADDVVFTITQAKKSPYLEESVVSIKDAVKIDDNTVRIDLNNQYAPFLLSLSTIYVLDDKAYTEGGKEYGQHPVGSGPYKFVKHDIGQRIVLERFDDYFKGKAPIKNVEFKVITDKNTSVIALQSGEIDMAYNIPAMSVQTVKSSPKLKTYDYESNGLTYVLMNCSKKPFNNVLVRQAISYAIDKDSVIKMAESGMGTKAEGVINKLTFGYSENVKGYELNIEKAKELLAEAGYPNGFSVKFKTMDGYLKKDAEVMQANLSKIGITVNLEICEQNTYLEDLSKGNYEMGDMAVALARDADAWSMIFDSKAGFNFSKYSNTKIDELFKKGRETVDEKQRLAIYEQLVQLINDDAVVVPIYFQVRPLAYNKDLKLGSITAAGTTKILDMTWSK